MPLRLVNRRYKHFRRYRQIVEVLVRQGFGFLVEQLDLQHFIPLRRRVLAVDRTRRHSRGARIRAGLEELGPTFVKLGQVLSTRTDIVPRDIIQELEQLQDHVPSFSFDQVERQFEADTGKRLQTAFAVFDKEPVAAASIGQVHRAVLSGGEQVVVKVQRPGIEEQTATDLEILYGLAGLAEDRFKPELFNPREMVDEFARLLKAELDYRTEARNMERFRRNLANDARVYIPAVFWELTSERVLTMEHVHGTKVNDVAALDALGVDRKQLARLGAEVFLKQVLIDGFFHGDPHPGNLFVFPDETLAMVDMGMVGRIDEDAMSAIADLFVGIIARDVDRVVRGMTRVGVLRDEANLRGLKRDMAELIDRHHGKSLKEIEMGTILNDSLVLAHKHKIKLPTDLVLLGKALLTMESIGKTLDPDFNAVEIAEPFAKDLIKRRWHPSRVTRKAMQGLGEYVDILGGLPRKLDRTLTLTNRGDLQVHFRHEGLEKLMHRVDVVSNRMAGGIVIAALVVGSSLIIQTDKGPLLWEFPVVGLLGYLFAGVIGVGLVISILRSGRF